MSDAAHGRPASGSPGGTGGGLYLLVERFRDGDAAPVYRRLRERGRALPAGVAYVSSWVTEDLARCYQVMRCESRAALDAWLAGWDDLVEFEVVPVVSSEEAAARALAGEPPP